MAAQQVIPLRALAVVLLVATFACQPPPVVVPEHPVDTPPAPSVTLRPPPIEPAEAAAFDASRAMAHLRFLADPARQGRYSGSPGYEEAARYVADQFAAAGLEPLEGGSFLQRFRMPLTSLTATPVFERLGPGGRAYRHRDDFGERVGGMSGAGDATGNIVFVGGAQKSGSYSDFEGADVRGKIALIAGPQQGDPVRTAVSEGAVAAIFVSDGFAKIKLSYIPRFDGAAVPVIIVTVAVADELVARSGKGIAELRAAVEQRQTRRGGDTVAFDTGIRARVAVPLSPVREIETANVVGLLRGSSPEDSKRAVLVGGHLDGVGVDPDGTVFPGANDNASGPAVTIELARALASRPARPQHSIIFVAFSGEEQGLLGSEAFAAQTVTSPGRAESLLAYINLDVVGCCGDVMAASEEDAALHARLKRNAARIGRDLVATGGSSDHATFVRRRVPAAILLWRENGPLHTPRDVVTLVEPSRLDAIGKVALLTALEIASGSNP